MSTGTAEASTTGPSPVELTPAEQLAPASRTRLRDRVAIVTGAGQGIGRAVARRLAAEGACVVVADLNPAGAERTTGELTVTDAAARAWSGDLRTPDGAASLLAAALEAFGRVEILVNNVGGATRLRPFVDWPIDAIEDEITRSLLPTVWCTRMALPHMVERGFGRIVNLGAESVRNGLWDRAPYTVGKGGVHALTTTVARETASLGITCNCVAPAATNTAADRLVPRYTPPADDPDDPDYLADLRARMLGTIPLGRSATADEQAGAVAFLASDDASFVTGQVLSVNGGSSMV